MIRFLLGAVCGLFLCTASALAGSEKDVELRKPVECHPAKDIIKFMTKMNSIKPERRDTVDSIMRAKFEVKDGGPFPNRLFVKDGEAETSLTIMPDGKVSDFSRIREFSEESELCAEDSMRAGQSKSQDDISFDIEMDVMFKNRSGTHTIAELEDGVGDGKSHYKKMVPGPFRMLVPKMTHVTVTYENETAPAQITAMKDGVAIDGLIIEPFSGSHVIAFEHLKDLGADTLMIAGGPYKLEPTPSIEKMKNLGGGEDDDDEDEN